MTLTSAPSVRPATGTEVSVFYDPLSYAAYDHPYEVYAQLRDKAPVYFNARRNLWVLSRYDDVKACLADHERFVNALGNDMDGTHDSHGPGNLIALDEPHHAVTSTSGPSSCARSTTSTRTCSSTSNTKTPNSAASKDSRSPPPSSERPTSVSRTTSEPGKAPVHTRSPDDGRREEVNPVEGSPPAPYGRVVFSRPEGLPSSTHRSDSAATTGRSAGRGGDRPA